MTDRRGFHDGNPPRVCRNGHRLGPWRVIVSTCRCDCDRARYGGHSTWSCRVCGDTVVADEHVDDSKLWQPLPGVPASERIPAED